MTTCNVRGAQWELLAVVASFSSLFQFDGTVTVLLSLHRQQAAQITWTLPTQQRGEECGTSSC